MIGEPKFKYGQHEQVTVRNHNRSIALERSVLKYSGLKPVLRDPNLVLSLCYGSKHTVNYSVRVKVFDLTLKKSNVLYIIINTPLMCFTAYHKVAFSQSLCRDCLRLHMCISQNLPRPGLVF